MSVDLMVNPKISDIKSISPYHVKVVIEPLERGFGHTLGNALRRVMMSSIPGFAATSVSIDGVVHEYDRVPGMSEDVIHIVLNLKKVVFKINDADSAVVRINKSCSGRITAADFILPHNVEVINEDQLIGSFSKAGSINMEVNIEKGIGYSPVSSREEKVQTFGSIPIDAVYSPVRRASFEVESARVGNRTDLDRLILNIETNGIYDCKYLIKQSSTILIRQFSVFSEVDIMKYVSVESNNEQDESQFNNKVLSEEISALDLSTRSQKCLSQENVRYIGDLVKRTERDLMKTPHLGKKSVTEIKTALARVSLDLGMDVSNWLPPVNPRR